MQTNIAVHNTDQKQGNTMNHNPNRGKQPQGEANERNHQNNVSRSARRTGLGGGSTGSAVAHAGIACRGQIGGAVPAVFTEGHH